MSDTRPGLFREEALRHASRGQHTGEPLRISPAWTRFAYWIVLVAFLFAIAGSAVGTIHEYAGGPAVVWIPGRAEVTASVDGIVRAVDVLPGEHVSAGALLARFDATREDAELARLDGELELQIVATLRDPADQAARSTLAALRTARDLAKKRVDQLSVRAPEDGIVGDIRIRPGQHLTAGDLVLSLVGDATQCSVLAMLPAQYRPQLRPGMPLRFEVRGYPYAYQEMIIDSVSAQIIGPSEVKRYLGQEIADTLLVDGPVVLVQSRAAAPTFEVDGHTFTFYHGMSGNAETPVRSEAILVTLFPGLRVLFDRWRRGR